MTVVASEERLVGAGLVELLAVEELEVWRVQ